MADIDRPHCQPISRHGLKTYLQVINLFQFHGLPAPPTELRDELVTALEWAWYGVEAAARIDKLEQAMERLGGMEGFSGSFYRNDNNEGRELLARTEFARAVLDQDKGGK